MNERIKELKKQATIETPIGHDIVKYVFSPEKFAELIVRECAEQIVEYQPRYLTHGQAREMAESIKQHFGVEE